MKVIWGGSFKLRGKGGGLCRFAYVPRTRGTKKREGSGRLMAGFGVKEKRMLCGEKMGFFGKRGMTI